MEFLKMNKLRKALKQTPLKKDNDNEAAAADIHNDNEESVDVDINASDEDDEDFIMNEVKRRLKELRRNSFMVLIPEEEEGEEEKEEEREEETECNEWRDVEEEGRRLWSCFGAFYDNYCNRMLFFDRLISTSMNQHHPCASKKFTRRCLSLNKTQLRQEEEEEDDDNYQLETCYVSQLCLTWEALHCQYTQLAAASQSDKCYNHSAQHFQQFHVLLHRFIENEPFQPGLRPNIYAHSRTSFPNLLQVPNISAQETKQEESDMLVRAPDLLRIIQTSILTFQMFIKLDKQHKKSSAARNPLQASLDKKKVKLKELWKRRKGGKKNEWPATQEEVELLLGLIDVKVMGRVLRMVNLTKEQLFWTEEKMNKLDVSTKLQRDPSPILFPC